MGAEARMLEGLVTSSSSSSVECEICFSIGPEKLQYDDPNQNWSDEREEDLPVRLPSLHQACASEASLAADSDV